MTPNPLTGLALLFFSAAVSCQPQPQAPMALPAPSESPAVVKDFDIFLDPPTGFVFVKLPQGWKFVGKVEESALASLPPKVITSLLPAERDEVVTSDARRGAAR